MAIQVLTRPEKTLSNGFLSKWNSSELPLRYELDSDLFPINKVDSSESITNITYNSSKRGTVITLSSPALSVVELDFVTVSGTGIEDLDGGNFQITEINGNDIVLDVKIEQSSNTGSILKYYRNYLGLVKVFAGAREGHPYNTDGSKPLEEIGIIEVNFTDDGVNNTGYANVQSFIKPDVSADFDKDFENSHFGWSSFYLQLSEIYDSVENGALVTFQSDFIDDVYDNCTAFNAYDNDSFNNGLTDWLQESIAGAYDEPWVSGVGFVSVSVQNLIGAGRNFYSTILYQNINLVNNNTYQFDIDVVFAGDSSSCGLRITDTLGNNLNQKQIDSSGVYSLFITPNTDITGVGLSITDVQLGKTATITLNSFVASYNGTSENLCLAINYANYGCKQFQDDLGGNFGDYVLNVEDSITPKMLTHFEELSYFYGKPFYLNSIIPNSTFSLSEDSDNLFVSLSFFDNQNNNVLSYNYKIDNLSDGVYTVDPNIKNELDSNNISECDWSYANVRFIIIPDNTFIDGNKGTFEGFNGLDGITMLPYSVGNPNQVGNDKFQVNFGRSSSNCMQVQISAPDGMNQPLKTYSLFTNDSIINVVEGRTYEIKAYLSASDSQIDPRHIDNGSLYLLPNGYTESECNVTKQLITDSFLYSTTEPTFEDWKEITTTFIAKTTEDITLTFYEDLINDISSGTGGDINIDDITFKGPIDFISESKKVNNKCSCSPYGVTLRWLNDLGGWESWYFDGKAIYSENVTQKVNIKRDITSNWDDTFINGETQNDTIKTTSNKSILVRSQLLTKNEQEVIQQIRRSARVQLLMDSGKYQTVTIKQGKFVINEEGDKTREVSFEISLPDTLTQEQ